MRIIRCNKKNMSDIRLLLPCAGKLTYTIFLFTATTALLPMNREVQSVSASV